EHLPRHRLPGRRESPGPAGEPAGRLHQSGSGLRPGDPHLRPRRLGHRGHRERRPSLHPVRAAALRRRQQPGGRGDPRDPFPARRFHRVLGMRLARRGGRGPLRHGVRDDQRDVRARSGRSWLGVLARWETLLVVAIAGLVVLGTLLSPFFLTPGNFSNLIAALMEVAIMALPMTLIIVASEIDLSVESMAGLASSLIGFLWAAGVPL